MPNRKWAVSGGCYTWYKALHAVFIVEAADRDAAVKAGVEIMLHGFPVDGGYHGHHVLAIPADGPGSTPKNLNITYE